MENVALFLCLTKVDMSFRTWKAYSEVPFISLKKLVDVAYHFFLPKELKEYEVYEKFICKNFEDGKHDTLIL
jgi:hypothetical protein